MKSGAEKYIQNIQRLLKTGGKLVLSLQKEFFPKDDITSDLDDIELKSLPNVGSAYQAWYSESLALISQILPERKLDFESYYKPDKARRDISHANYTISDYLRGITVTRSGSMVVGPNSALQPMYQQFNIVQGLLNRFTSTLYDIKTLVQADLLDDQLQAAQELNSNGYQRAAGAVAGVVLEGHLAAVCERHGITLRRKDPGISDLNDALKTANIVETASWRYIQHLGDIRNKCDHKKASDPNKEEVNELIEGVKKIVKTLL